MVTCSPFLLKTSEKCQRILRTDASLLTASLTVRAEHKRRQAQNFKMFFFFLFFNFAGLGDEISDEDLKRLQSLLIIGSTFIAKNARKIDSKSSKDEFLIQIPDILEAMQDVDI